MLFIFYFLIIYLQNISSILVTNGGNNNNNKVKKYYVYDWPESLVDLWPNLTSSTSDMKITSKLNYGVGDILNSTIGMFDTFQFGLFRLFHRRALIDYRRTMNPDEATLFFIPYDSAFDAIVTPRGKVRTPGCPRGLAIIELLAQSPYFRRNYGHDHFLMHSANQVLGSMNNKGACKQYLSFACENCTKLVIDTYHNGGFAPHYRSVPFTSNIHWNTDMSLVPWNQIYPQRKFAVSFTGSTWSYSKGSRAIREKILSECQLFSEYCKSNVMTSHDSSAAPPDWTVPLQSTFCIMPPGDVPTRKGFFDSILMGCIPVVFNPQSAHKQWLYHLGNEIALATTIYFPASTFMRDQNHTLMNLLIRLHSENDEVVMKRKAISKHASKLQYRLPEGEYLNEPFYYEKYNSNTKTIQKLTPPIDAFDTIIDNLLNDPLLADIKDMVENPRDRGDYAGQDYFKEYPVGKTRQNLTHSPLPSCFIVCKK